MTKPKDIDMSKLTPENIEFQFCSDWLKDEIRRLFLQIHSLKVDLFKEDRHCRHPKCCCVCGHTGRCPEDGPSITSDLVD